MCVDVPQDGDGLHGIGVPDTDVRVLPHLTRRHLDLIWMDRQTDRDRHLETRQLCSVSLCVETRGVSTSDFMTADSVKPHQYIWSKYV